MNIRIERWSDDRLTVTRYSFVLLDRGTKMSLRCVAVNAGQRPTTRHRNMVPVEPRWTAYSPHSGERPDIPEDVQRDALRVARDNIILE